jgi:hypothetical protein
MSGRHNGQIKEEQIAVLGIGQAQEFLLKLAADVL